MEVTEKSATVEFDKWNYFVICNYASYTNEFAPTVTKPLYKKGAVCSDCPADRPCDASSEFPALCGGGMIKWLTKETGGDAPPPAASGGEGGGGVDGLGGGDGNGSLGGGHRIGTNHLPFWVLLLLACFVIV